MVRRAWIAVFVIVGLMLAACEDEREARTNELRELTNETRTLARDMFARNDLEGIDSERDRLEAAATAFARDHLSGLCPELGGPTPPSDEALTECLGANDIGEPEAGRLRVLSTSYDLVQEIDDAVAAHVPAWTAPPAIDEAVVSRITASTKALNERQQWLFQTAFHPDDEMCRLDQDLDNEFDRGNAMQRARALFAEIEPVSWSSELFRVVIPLSLGEWNPQTHAFAVKGEMPRNLGYRVERDIGSSIEGSDVLLELRGATLCSGGGAQYQLALSDERLPGQVRFRVRLSGLGAVLTKGIPVERDAAERYVRHLESANMRGRPLAAVAAMRLDPSPSIEADSRGSILVAEYTGRVQEVAIFPYGQPAETENRFIGEDTALIDWDDGRPMTILAP